jgi:hypothetical protein
MVCRGRHGDDDLNGTTGSDTVHAGGGGDIHTAGND